jgi:hypothetical protein
VVGVTVTVTVSLGDGITGSGSTSGALRNSSQAIRIASTMMIAIAISDIVIANGGSNWSSQHLELEGIRPSIGSVGDAYDNALMETINGLYKAECIRTTVFHDGPCSQPGAAVTRIRAAENLGRFKGVETTIDSQHPTGRRAKCGCEACQRSGSPAVHLIRPRLGGPPRRRRKSSKKTSISGGRLSHPCVSFDGRNLSTGRQVIWLRIPSAVGLSYR